jgi:putative solute:sodium symporter small subunit
VKTGTRVLWTEEVLKKGRFHMAAAKERVDVNFFKPSTAGMKAEVGVASTVILFWALLSYGIPTLIWLAGLGDPAGLGQSFLTEARFLGFPLHYWLIAQGCTIGYILLCKLYCVLWDAKVTPKRKG